MSSIFGLQCSYMLEYSWLFALLLRSARCSTGVEGKWTLLPPVSPPSSNTPIFDFVYRFPWDFFKYLSLLIFSMIGFVKKLYYMQKFLRFKKICIIKLYSNCTYLVPLYSNCTLVWFGGKYFFHYKINKFSLSKACIV